MPSKATFSEVAQYFNAKAKFLSIIACSETLLGDLPAEFNANHVQLLEELRDLRSSCSTCISSTQNPLFPLIWTFSKWKASLFPRLFSGLLEDFRFYFQSANGSKVRGAQKTC